MPEGVYTFTVTAQGLGAQSQTTDFTWTLDYLCNNRACPTITPVSYTITETAASIDFSSLVVSGCTLNWDFSISPTPTDGGFVTQPGSGPSLSVFWDTDLVPASEFDTMANPFVSQYTVTVTGSNTDPYSISCPVTLTVDTPCDSITFSDPGQNDLTDTYTGVEKFFVLSEFTITPTICTPTVDYSVTNVQGPDASDYSSLATGWIYPGDANGNLGLTATVA